MANENEVKGQADSKANFTNYAKPMDSGWCKADEEIYQFRQNISNAFPIQLVMHEATVPFSVYQGADGKFHEDDGMPSYNQAMFGDSTTIYASREEAGKINEALANGTPLPEDVVDKVAKRAVEANVAKMLDNPMTQFIMGFLIGAAEREKIKQNYIG